MIPVLKQVGNVDSFTQRFIKVVIGVRSESRHDFRTTVGIKSSAHVASDDLTTAALTSTSVAGVKSEKSGGRVVGMVCGEAPVSGRDARSFVILSPKNVRKVDASEVVDDMEGNVGRDERDSRVFSVVQSLRGCLNCVVTIVL